MHIKLMSTFNEFFELNIAHSQFCLHVVLKGIANASAKKPTFRQ